MDLAYKAIGAIGGGSEPIFHVTPKSDELGPGGISHRPSDVSAV
jgi:hypothetical protein